MGIAYLTFQSRHHTTYENHFSIVHLTGNNPDHLGATGLTTIWHRRMYRGFAPGAGEGSLDPIIDVPLILTVGLGGTRYPYHR